MQMGEKPILFACTLNGVRSVMAEAIYANLSGKSVQSCGVMPGPANGFTAAVMQEIGLDVSDHVAQDFMALSPADFGLVISMSSEAKHEAARWAGDKLEHKHWPILEPGGGDGNREAQLSAYRAVRDEIITYIKETFEL